METINYTLNSGTNVKVFSSDYNKLSKIKDDDYVMLIGNNHMVSLHDLNEQELKSALNASKNPIWLSPIFNAGHYSSSRYQAHILYEDSKYYLYRRHSVLHKEAVPKKYGKIVGLFKKITDITNDDLLFSKDLDTLLATIVVDNESFFIKNELNTEAITQAKEDKAQVPHQLPAAAPAKGLLCTSCGNQVEAGKPFCTGCGAKTHQLPAGASANAKGLLCTSCGNQVEAGKPFCTRCGFPQNNPPASAAAQQQQHQQHGAQFQPGYPQAATDAWLPPIPRGVKVLETYRINILSGGTATLCISNGSFVNFKGGDHGAIVNAANGGGIGGGGADGAVNSMGISHNPNLDLKTARENEMKQRNKKPLDYGEVMITSAPLGKFYGKLQSRHVIHAVGPDYRTMCELGDGINLKYDSDSLQLELDNNLYDAYKNSIQKASENGVKALGFCLLSGNIYRKNNNQEDIVSLNHVIKLGMNSIMHNAYNGLEVHMIAFEDDEEQIKTLLEEFNKKIKGSRGGKRTSKKKVKRTKTSKKKVKRKYKKKVKRTSKKKVKSKSKKKVKKPKNIVKRTKK